MLMVIKRRHTSAIGPNLLLVAYCTCLSTYFNQSLKHVVALFAYCLLNLLGMKRVTAVIPKPIPALSECHLP